MRKIKLDAFEKKIEKNISKYHSISNKKQAKILKTIKNANERKNISLRINNQDLDIIKLRAKKEGIPYQTFISSILHKFITEQTSDKFVFPFL